MPGKPVQKITNADKEGIDVSAYVRLGQVETNLSNLSDDIKTLGTLITKSDDKRSTQWDEYLREHGKVVSDCRDNTDRLTRLEVTINRVALNTAANINKLTTDTNSNIKTLTLDAANSIKTLATDTAAEIKAINEKIASLPTIIKILGAVSVFFMSAIGGLIWAIITHSVEIVHIMK